MVKTCQGINKKCCKCVVPVYLPRESNLFGKDWQKYGGINKEIKEIKEIKETKKKNFQNWN